MSKTAASLAKIGDFTCVSCGAVYGVKLRELSVRDRTVANCAVCGSVMADWNSAIELEFVLKERPRPARPASPNSAVSSDDDEAEDDDADEAIREETVSISERGAH